MEYYFETWTIKEIIDHYINKRINLNPPYQRNDIWSLKAKKRLIDTILRGYPLPSLFFHKTDSSHYDVVDGQQRIRTIKGFSDGLFTTEENKKIEEINSDYFFNQYPISVIVIEEIVPKHGESMEEFYYRVNKFGTKLNRPEILQAQHFDNPFQKLIERITESDEFRSIDIFADSLINRMIDYDFVGELIVLLKYGITEKKITVDKLFSDPTFTDEQAEDLGKKFFKNFTHIIRFNKIYPIKETRYKQRNDFYTLFHFIHENSQINVEILSYLYSLLVLFSDDIIPTNEECYAFQNYAFHCVSQSNSKKAREERHKIFVDILLNVDPNPFTKKGTDQENSNLLDVLDFYHFKQDDLIQKDKLFLLDVNKLNSIKKKLL